ncbi:MAG: response regulator [Verrucomicrobia bacterium]|jgi:DNA-binding NarL/FixJ family response regulator|nr:response regulator [Verrucomicrobiota bacterium]
MEHCLIIEDIPDSRQWLAGIVTDAFPDCRIHEAATLRLALNAIEGSTYDLAMIDLRLPDGSGVEALRCLQRRSPKTACVVTTVLGDDANIVAALSAGAKGYLVKEQPTELLSQQLRQLAMGIPALSPAIAHRIMTHFQRTGPCEPEEDRLTQRERQILSLISRGLRNAEVAKQLGVAESTVASHIKSVYRKLDISSRAEAAWHATRLGL